jgi:hypothetical protein
VHPPEIYCPLKDRKPKNKKEPWEEYVEKIVSEEMPSFHCIRDERLRELLWNDVLGYARFLETCIQSFEIRQGKQVISVRNIEGAPDLVSELSLLRMILLCADEKEKSRASRLIIAPSLEDLFLRGAESGFNEMSYVLAFLAKRVWNTAERMRGRSFAAEKIEACMKSLDEITILPVY